MAPIHKMFDFLKDNPLVCEAKKARLRPRSLAIAFLLFFAVMTASEFVAGIPSTLYLSFRAISLLGPEFFLNTELTPEEMSSAMLTATETALAEEAYLLISLFSMALLLLIVVVFCRFIERRSLASMGFCGGKHAVISYALGILLGLLAFSLTFLLMLATGSLTVAGGAFRPGMLLLYLLAFLIQGAAEEVLVRGYFMISLTNTTGTGRALIFSSLLFAILHIGNVGVSFLAVLNIFLFGLLLGLIVFRTGNIFLACALHGIWNFAEGCIFGTRVSGLAPGSSLLVSTPDLTRALTNGGEFGPEGGAAVTLVLILALAVFLLLLPSKPKKEADAE